MLVGLEVGNEMMHASEAFASNAARAQRNVTEVLGACGAVLLLLVPGQVAEAAIRGWALRAEEWFVSQDVAAATTILDGSIGCPVVVEDVECLSLMGVSRNW
jgi:hypothetical protein